MEATWLSSPSSCLLVKLPISLSIVISLSFKVRAFRLTVSRLLEVIASSKVSPLIAARRTGRACAMFVADECEVCTL